jgi:hypothetical protein
MLELLITLRRTWGTGTIGGANKTNKVAGYIICAKKQPANWGVIERQYFLITLLDAPLLEAQFGDRNIWSYPLATYDAQGVIIKRSEYRVDLSMFTGTEGLDPNIIVTQPTPPNGAPNLTVAHLIAV